MGKFVTFPIKNSNNLFGPQNVKILSVSATPRPAFESATPGPASALYASAYPSQS